MFVSVCFFAQLKQLSNFFEGVGPSPPLATPMIVKRQTCNDCAFVRLGCIITELISKWMFLRHDLPIVQASRPPFNRTLHIGGAGPRATDGRKAARPAISINHRQIEPR